jgi:lipoyl(octanoyl) transferase
LQQPKKICWVLDCGLIAYRQAWELQKQLVTARKRGAIPDTLLLCEHPHVITIGRNGNREHLLASDDLLAQKSIEIHQANRGGDITYHGPGQIVGYPIVDLAEHRRDVRWYVQLLEEVMLRATLDHGIAGKRINSQRGVWVDTPAGEEKLAALGVHMSRWVTSHGFAYNVSTDLSYFDLIVPCGIRAKRVTSLERILGPTVSTRQVRERLRSHFGEVFECRLENVWADDLAEIFAAQAQDADNVVAATA